MEEKQKKAENWFHQLRDEICAEFEKIEQEFDPKAAKFLLNFDEIQPAQFTQKPWQRPEGGEGVISALRGGRVFEKVAVNVSTVHGSFSEEFAKKIPGAMENDGQFWASGISLIAHLNSPLVPAVHMNTRHICTSKTWFGGGADLTPMVENQQDTEFFHKTLKEACDQHNPKYYPEYKEWADRYFYLKHRNEPRGIGGIFYDYLDSNNWQNDFNFTKDVGKAFIKAYFPLVRQHMHKAWTQEQREHQLEKRGRYVEFNLLYDRGTTFGLSTGGNVESILMSLPPTASWP